MLNLNLNLKQKVKSNVRYMGAKHSTPETAYIEEFKRIDENDLDIINLDKLQIKVIKELIDKVEALEDKKSDKITYKLPALNLCSYSLF